MGGSFAIVVCPPTDRRDGRNSSQGAIVRRGEDPGKEDKSGALPSAALPPAPPPLPPLPPAESRVVPRNNSALGEGGGRGGPGSRGSAVRAEPGGGVGGHRPVGQRAAGEDDLVALRSEERRVGKECRSRGAHRKS